MRSFEQGLPEFRARRTRIVAISVDSPDASRDLARKQGYTFTILSDPRAEAIRAYGILHAHAGEEGQDIARPAEFLVDETGTIRWVNLAETLLARLRPETVLHALDAMSVSVDHR